MSIAMDMARALAAAHAKRIVHRDIKPDNVMLAANGSVKVLDFGLAKWREAEGEAVDAEENEETITAATEAGRVLGTPAYMSPEQAMGEAVDVASDVFSLGVVLYEMLGGRRPFEGTTTQKLLIAVARDSPEPLEDCRWWPLLERMLDKAASERPTAAELAKALGAQPEEAADEAVTPDDASEATPTKGRDTPTTPSRRGMWLAVAAAVGVAVVVGVGVSRLDGGPTPSGRESASGPSGSASASASASAPGAKMGIMDLPIYGDPKPEAVAAYRKGLQARRDAAWQLSRISFDEAVKLDPSFAQAWLRKAQSNRWSPKNRLDTGRTLATLRDELKGRDRALFEAMRPILLEASPDLPAFTKAMRELADRYPGDAEIQQMCGSELRSREPEAAVRYGEQAVAIDPEFADAWQTLGDGHKSLGQNEAAIRAYPQVHRSIADRGRLPRGTLGSVRLGGTLRRGGARWSRAERARPGGRRQGDASARHGCARRGAGPGARNTRTELE